MLAARASTPAARQLTVERLQSCGGACHEPVIALMQARGPPILAKRAQWHDMTGADKPRVTTWTRVYMTVLTTLSLNTCFLVSTRGVSTPILAMLNSDPLA